MFADTMSDRARFSQTGGACRSRSDRDIILIVYVLYGLGFFTGITAIAGVMLAHHQRRRTSGDAARRQFSWQIRMFWTGVLAWIAIGLAHGAVAALGAITGGIGLIFMVVPWSMIAVWGLLTVWAMARGLIALGRGHAVI